MGLSGPSPISDPSVFLPDAYGPDRTRLLPYCCSHLLPLGGSTRLDSILEHLFRYHAAVGTWHDPDLGRPIAAPLERCAELLGVDLATVRELAADVEPYIRSDGIQVWSLRQLERQLRPEVYRRRRGGYVDRQRTQTTDA